MSLNRSQQKLIINATKSLSVQDANFVMNVISSLADKSEWFRFYFFTILKQGVSFKYLSNKGRIITSYDDVTKTIGIGKDYLNNALPHDVKETLLKMVLRSSSTQVMDHLDYYHKNPDIKRAVVAKMASANKFFNSLYDSLRCIDQGNRLNAHILTVLRPYLFAKRNFTGQLFLEHEPLGIENFEAVMKKNIENIGSFPNVRTQFNNNYFTRYVLNGWKIKDKKYVFQITHDLSQIFQKFNKTRTIREANGLLSLESIFYQSVDSNLHRTWDKLDNHQKNILNLLYSLRNSVHPIISQDPICFPRFNDCLNTIRANCFNTFLDCQKRTDPDNWYSTTLTLRSIQRERVDAHLVNPEHLSDLCTELSADEKALPVPGLISSLVKTSAFSFVSETTNLYMQNKSYSGISIVQLILTCGFIYLSSLFEQEKDSYFKVGLAVLLFKYVLDRYLNENQKKKTNYVFTGLLMAPQVLSEGPAAICKTLATGSVGHYIGSSLASSMARGLGWRTKAELDRIHNEIIEVVIPITKDNKFASFLKSINERNYTQALRRACTSNDPKAFDIVEGLLRFKDVLKINLDEMGGDKKRTALHYAAIIGNDKVYNYLLEEGANCYIKDKDGVNPEQYMDLHLSTNRKRIINVLV